MEDLTGDRGARSSNAAKAKALASRLRAEGRLRDAAIYQLNGLTHDPSDPSLLTEHVAVVVALVEQHRGAGDIEEAEALLTELERTLAGLLGRTDPDHLEAVRAHLGAVQGMRNQLDARSSSTPARELHLLDQKLTSALARIAQGRFDWSVPPEDVVASTRLAEVAALIEAADEADDVVDRSVRDRLMEFVEALRRSVGLDEACTDATAAMKSAAQEEDTRISVALLQQGEAALRGYLPTLRTLDAARQDKLLRRLDALTKALEGELSALRSERSKARWQAFLTETGSALDEARRWAPNASVFTGSKHHDAQLQRVQKLMDGAGEVLRELDDPGVRRIAGGLLRELGELASKAAAAQREAYGRWAINLVQQCFERASQHIKVTGNDEEGMDDTIVTILGDVNPALLSTEAGRAYTEVLEYFLAKLYAPGKDKGFDKPGARLRVLKRLAQSNKAALSDF